MPVAPPEPITVLPPRAVLRPVMRQGWHDLTLLHWRFEPEVVQALLPDGFRVDTFDGSAWVGVVPFRMERIRFPGLPPFGPLSTFPETNVRTYIVEPSGRRGVWFFSLDITRLATALVARASYRVPYCWARMRIDGTGDDRTYSSRRRWPTATAGASTHAQIRIGAKVDRREVTDLDHFLTARWALGTTFGRRLMWAEVDHPAWTLHEAEVVHVDESIVVAAGLPAPVGQPIVRWSPGVEVRIALPRRVR